MYISDHETLRALNARLLENHDRRAVQDAIDASLKHYGAKCVGDLPKNVLSEVYKNTVSRLQPEPPPRAA